MKKNIIALLSGLVVGFIVFWAPSASSKLFGTDRILFYRFLNGLFQRNQILITASYLILGVFGFFIYWLFMKLLKSREDPFPIVASLLFAFGFVLPLGLLGWAVATAFSHGSFPW